MKNISKFIKTKIIPFTGVFWFLMDISWYWKLDISAGVFSIITLLCTLLLFFVENIKSFDDKNLVIAINSWLLINIGAMISELYQVSYEVKDFIILFNTLFTISGLVSLVILLISNKINISKFKRF